MDRGMEHDEVGRRVDHGVEQDVECMRVMDKVDEVVVEHCEMVEVGHGEQEQCIVVE